MWTFQYNIEIKILDFVVRKAAVRILALSLTCHVNLGQIISVSLGHSQLPKGEQQVLSALMAYRMLSINFSY